MTNQRKRSRMTFVDEVFFYAGQRHAERNIHTERTDRFITGSYGSEAFTIRIYDDFSERSLENICVVNSRRTLSDYKNHHTHVRSHKIILFDLTNEHDVHGGRDTIDGRCVEFTVK
ncbi:hypothetical protein NY2A_b231R [Paramecium bursaria Chlorella virus NY2A]|uniref:Uncharacterized protein b231R n=1 Tax=Paramecium bursaria Chlorella virus NY2A TaxID=46021 RepID=A7IWA6_PBCVN|nr:hypothetical protein NY2A_b231R [Paramecium bursaria Chlorella virus NY2A]ABT14630.1 hypothetical protein NY2A_b231R [Paramecium bursaria Chlorella virus NY2A]